MRVLNQMEKQLPEVGVTVTPFVASEWVNRCPPGRETFFLAEMVTETLLDSEVDALRPESIVEFVMLGATPLIIETMALQIAFGQKIAERESKRMARGMPSPLFEGDEQRRPSVHRCAHAMVVLRRVAAFYPGKLGAGVLCVIAWLAWARGRRALAVAYLDEARRLDPEYVLARRLSGLVTTKLPEWLPTEIESC
ncbi:DUF4192 family protein [Microbacterium protaetiae]|uniref:DUF4192 family protein n=1 Tax=Microbacterium protaetiae TaxID=2509458 RepID=UPI0013ECD7C9|nr:DUF4192 family protein [Microbacterium protaetiae]